MIQNKTGGREFQFTFVLENIFTSSLWFQVLVDGSETTVVLQSLTPLTEYFVNVYAVAGDVSSDPLKGSETTCKSLTCKM